MSEYRNCPECGSSNVRPNGSVAGGKKKLKCHECGHQFLMNEADYKYPRLTYTERPEDFVPAVYAPDPPEQGMTDKFREWIGDTWKYSPLAFTVKSGKRRKVVVVGDLHGNPDPILATEIAAANPDLIIVAGDLTDQQEASTHPQDSPAHPRTIDQEIAAVRATLEYWIDQTHASIEIICGNHDKWIYKRLKSSVPEWAMKYFRDPMDAIIFELPPERVEKITTALEWHYPSGEKIKFGETDFLLPVGDAIVSHMNNTGAKAGQGVMRFSERIDQWIQPLGLPIPVLLIQAHGHKVAHLEDHGGHRILIEPGVGGMMSIESYKMVYEQKWNPGGVGACYFEQSNIHGEWKTDLGSVALIRPHRSRPNMIEV